MIERLARLRCRLLHRRIFRPAHGKYTCCTCLRQWPVTWHKISEPELSPALPQKPALERKPA